MTAPYEVWIDRLGQIVSTESRVPEDGPVYHYIRADLTCRDCVEMDYCKASGAPPRCRKKGWGWWPDDKACLDFASKECDGCER